VSQNGDAPETSMEKLVGVDPEGRSPLGCSALCPVGESREGKSWLDDRLTG
jgi:hypothetical protein